MPKDKDNQKKNIINDAIIKELNDAVGNIKYGGINITVHNSRIVQVEVSEKKRFDDVWTVEEGGGI